MQEKPEEPRMNVEGEPDRNIEAAAHVPKESTVGKPDVLVFYGDAEQVAAGFAFALEAMQVQADLPRIDEKRGRNSR